MVVRGLVWDSSTCMRCGCTVFGIICPLRTFTNDACGARSRKSGTNRILHVSLPSRIPPPSTRYTRISRLLRLRKQLRPKPHILHGRGSRRANCGRHIARSHRPCEGRHSARSHSPCEGRPRHVATCTARYAGIHNPGSAWAVWVEQRPCADLEFTIQVLRDSESAQMIFGECTAALPSVGATRFAPHTRRCSFPQSMLVTGKEWAWSRAVLWGLHLCFWSSVNTRVILIIAVTLCVTWSHNTFSNSFLFAPISWLLTPLPRVCLLQHMPNIVMS